MYSKLVLIADKNFNKVKASNYLLELASVAPDKIRIDAKMKWIEYQRELENYDGVISEIQRMLGLAEFSSEHMRLELELGKVYMDNKDFSTAKEIFAQMVEVYSKKNETAEAYYHLGNITLREDFNLDLTKEYFEKSKTEKSQSKYGKKSKEDIMEDKADEFIEGFNIVIHKNGKSIIEKIGEQLIDRSNLLPI